MSRSRAPFPIRLVVALLFAGFAASAVASAWPELSHLVDAISRPFHSGTPPDKLAIAGVALAVLGLIPTVVFALRGGRFLIGGGLVLVGFVLALVASPKPARRTWAGADAEILEVARALAERINEQGRASGAFSQDEAAWRRVLDEVARSRDGTGLSPVRDARFEQRPYSLRFLSREDESPQVDPGTFLVWISPSGSVFQLTPVGFDRQGRAAALTDDKGERLVLRSEVEPK